MAKRAVKKKLKINRFVYWTPRILSILFICFLSLFSLDIFDMKLGFWGTIVGLFMHLIPSIILIAFLLVAWRFEWVGAAAFILFGFWYVSIVINNVIRSQLAWYIALSWSLTIAGPAFLVGILFLANWIVKKK